MDRGIIPEDVIADLGVGDGVAHGWGGLGDGIATEIDGHKAPIEKGGRGDRQRNFRGEVRWRLGGGVWVGAFLRLLPPFLTEIFRKKQIKNHQRSRLRAADLPPLAFR